MGRLTSTHTFAELEVSPEVYAEVAGLLRDAGYGHVFMDGGAIDMHGIGLTQGERRKAWTTKELDERREAHRGRGWIGVDLDGTLARWSDWVSYDVIGEPIPAMVDRVRRFLREGHEVRVLTARIHLEGELVCPITQRRYRPDDVRRAVQAWCLEHIGQLLPVTCVKDSDMIELWDDRAIQVITNTGRTIHEEHQSELAAVRGAP